MAPPSPKTPPSRLTPLAFLQPRETARIRKARAPRRWQNGLRYGLPLVALLVVAALFAWPYVNPNQISGAVLKNLPDIVVKNPHYTGVDAKDQSYSLSAATATRPSGAGNLFDLTQPQGELMLQSGNWVAGKAQFGRYDQSSRKLWLGGNVELFHDKGYSFTSDEAQVDLEHNLAWGEKPVLIQGEFGEIHGQGFRLLDGGHILVVTGPVKAILNLHSGEASDKPSGSPKKE